MPNPVTAEDYRMMLLTEDELQYAPPETKQINDQIYLEALNKGINPAELPSYSHIPGVQSQQIQPTGFLGLPYTITGSAQAEGVDPKSASFLQSLLGPQVEFTGSPTRNWELDPNQGRYVPGGSAQAGGVDPRSSLGLLSGGQDPRSAFDLLSRTRGEVTPPVETNILNAINQNISPRSTIPTTQHSTAPTLSPNVVPEIPPQGLLPELSFPVDETAPGFSDFIASRPDLGIRSGEAPPPEGWEEYLRNKDKTMSDFYRESLAGLEGEIPKESTKVEDPELWATIMGLATTLAGGKYAGPGATEAVKSVRAGMERDREFAAAEDARRKEDAYREAGLKQQGIEWKETQRVNRENQRNIERQLKQGDLELKLKKTIFDDEQLQRSIALNQDNIIQYVAGEVVSGKDIDLEKLFEDMKKRYPNVHNELTDLGFGAKIREGLSIGQTQAAQNMLQNFQLTGSILQALARDPDMVLTPSQMRVVGMGNIEKLRERAREIERDTTITALQKEVDFQKSFYEIIKTPWGDQMVQVAKLPHTDLAKIGYTGSEIQAIKSIGSTGGKKQGAIREKYPTAETSEDYYRFKHQEIGKLSQFIKSNPDHPHMEELMQDRAEAIRDVTSFYSQSDTDALQKEIKDFQRIQGETGEYPTRFGGYGEGVNLPDQIKYDNFFARFLPFLKASNRSLWDRLVSSDYQVAEEISELSLAGRYLDGIVSPHPSWLTENIGGIKNLQAPVPTDETPTAGKNIQVPTGRMTPLRQRRLNNIISAMESMSLEDRQAQLNELLTDENFANTEMGIQIRNALSPQQ